MADDKSTTGTGAPDDTAPRTSGAVAPGGAGAGNVAVADASAPAADPLAYRERGDNGRKRAEWMERVIVDHFYSGDVRRFDTAAGLDFDA